MDQRMQTRTRWQRYLVLSLAILFGGLWSYASSPAAAASGLVAAYGFNEGRGRVANDLSGQGNAATIAGAIWISQGKFGNALNFNGTSDLVTVPDAPTLDLTSGMTLEAWVFPSQTGSWRTILMKEQANDLVYGLYSRSDTGRPRGYVFIGGKVDVAGTANLPAGAWSHLATTYDGTTLRLYVNGVEVASRAVPGAIATSNGALRIGGNSLWGEFFSGRIDEVRIYNRALTAAELQADMVAPVSSPVASATATRTSTRTATRTNTALPVKGTATRTNTAVPPSATATRTNTALPPSATATRTNTAVPPSATATRTNTAVPPSATAVATSTSPVVPPTATSAPAAGVRESFEGAVTGWQVSRSTTGSGTVDRSTLQFAGGSASARAATTSSGSSASVLLPFSDPASAHAWNERPGTFRWQQASVFLPASTIARLGPTDYLTLGYVGPSVGGTYGWSLRVRQNGALYVAGYDSNGAASEFRAYGSIPTDRWVSLELGLHSQNGPGVKRAFAFLLDGQFYGWYRQGHLAGETYDRVALGIVNTTSAGPLEVFVDEWREPGTGNLPTGPDTRPTDAVQEQDFRSQSGVQVQYDWSTWTLGPTLSASAGLYSANDRIQAGRNLDRMPDLTSGWAEIEVDWPQGTPNGQPTTYFGPMVGFRKEVNREENLEVIPVGRGAGNVELVFEAWVGSPVELGQWQMPLNAAGTSRIPEPGDIIRVRWEQVSAGTLGVRASYYDASTATWYVDIINGVYPITSISGGGNTVNYTDGFHTASSVTIDSPFYSIRRYRVGTLATYP